MGTENSSKQTISNDQQRLVNVEKRLSEVEKTIGGVDKKLDKVITFLKGDDELDKEEGFISQNKKLEERVKKIEDFMQRSKYILIGMGVTSGYGLFEFAKKYLPLLFQ